MAARPLRTRNTEDGSSTAVKLPKSPYVSAKQILKDLPQSGGFIQPVEKEDGGVG